MKVEDILKSDHLNNPIGSNELGSLGSFYWRGIYKSFIYPDMVEKPIDMWYENIQYGRVNSAGDAIYPADPVLKQVATDGDETILAVNFVADAWADLKSYVVNSVASGKINNDDSLYGGFDAVKGWESVHSLYHEWNSVFYEVFSGSFMNSVRDQRIVNFKGFVGVYLEFVDKMTIRFPQSRENWITSNWCTPLCSGLIIEIEKAPYGEDEIKSKFINDRSFQYISQVARKFGFKIDKNAPWRFVADLDSEKMKSYMKKYDLDSAKDLYKKFYYNSYYYEYDVFKHYVWSWYNAYVTANPMSNKVKARKTNTQTTLILEEREQLTEEEAFEKYPEQLWVRLYAYVRAKETHRKWNQARFNKVVKRIIDFWRIKGRRTAMKFLQKSVKQGPENLFSLKKHLTKEQLSSIMEDDSIKRTKDSFLF